MLGYIKSEIGCHMLEEGFKGLHLHNMIQFPPLLIPYYTFHKGDKL